MTTDLLPVLEANSLTHVNRYFVTLTFDGRVLGGQPRARGIMEKRLTAQLAQQNADAEKAGEAPPFSEAEIARILASHQERLGDAGLGDDDIHESIELAWTTFYRDGQNRPYLGIHQVKAALRKMITSTGITQSKRGSKQTFQHLQAVWGATPDGQVAPGEGRLQIHFYRDGAMVEAPDGAVDMTAHVMTAQGPRSVLKRHDFVEQATVHFVVDIAARLRKSRDTAVLTDEDMATMLLHAQGNGLGCSRSQGFGTFRVVGLIKQTDNPYIVG